MTIGERLRQQRTTAAMTQKNVAAALHVSRKTISSWENGRSYPDIASLIALSRLFSVSVDALIKEDGELVTAFEHQAKVLHRVQWLGRAALMINLLLGVGFIATSFAVTGFALGTYWEAILIGIMMINFWPLIGMQVWRLQLRGVSPLLKLMMAWIYGVIIGGMLAGFVFVGLVYWLHLSLWWLGVWMLVYFVGSMLSFFWYGKRHNIFDK